MKNVYPTSTLSFNNPNTIKFNIDFEDIFYSSKFQYFISGSLIKAEGREYPAVVILNLIDNFVSLLFSRTKVRRHNKLIGGINILVQ